MTLTPAQAEAILQAERELQHLRCGGPDYAMHSGWYTLVEEAVTIYDANPKTMGPFEDLALVVLIRGSK